MTLDGCLRILVLNYALTPRTLPERGHFPLPYPSLGPPRLSVSSAIPPLFPPSPKNSGPDSSYKILHFTILTQRHNFISLASLCKLDLRLTQRAASRGSCAPCPCTSHTHMEVLMQVTYPTSYNAVLLTTPHAQSQDLLSTWERYACINVAT